MMLLRRIFRIPQFRLGTIEKSRPINHIKKRRIAGQGRLPFRASSASPSPPPRCGYTSCRARPQREDESENIGALLNQCFFLLPLICCCFRVKAEASSTAQRDVSFSLCSLAPQNWRSRSRARIRRVSARLIGCGKETSYTQRDDENDPAKDGQQDDPERRKHIEEDEGRLAADGGLVRLRSLERMSDIPSKKGQRQRQRRRQKKAEGKLHLSGGVGGGLERDEVVVRRADDLFERAQHFLRPARAEKK